MSKDIFFQVMESNYSELDQIQRTRIEMWIDTKNITDAELVKLADVITAEWVNEKYTREFPKLPIIKKYFERVRVYSGPLDKASRTMSVLHAILEKSKTWTAMEIWQNCRKIQKKDWDELTGEERMKYTHFMHYWDDLYNIGCLLKERSWSDHRIETYLETVKLSIVNGDRVVYPELQPQIDKIKKIADELNNNYPSFRDATPVEGMI